MAKEKLNRRAAKFMRQIKKEVSAKLRAERKAAFDSTTLEQRKAFITLIHAGKTVGEARELACIPTLDAAMAVLKRNTRTIKYQIIEPVEKVR